MATESRFPFLVKKIISPIQGFIRNSRATGIVLIACTVLSLVMSNVHSGGAYAGFWETELPLSFGSVGLPHSLLHFINDALMAGFFLLAGMEIKREICAGELSSFQKSALPVFAAIGGMLFPAGIYLLWNVHSGFAHGWGVPMATDIAFSLGVLSLLGTRAPFALKVLLTALAIIDDLGSILAIALFYTDHVSGAYLAASGGVFLLLLVMNRSGVRQPFFYIAAGLVLWYCMYHSGVHATLAGVLLAFTIPLEKIPAWEHWLHTPVNFIILPLFALANTAIPFPPGVVMLLADPVSYGIFFGLLAGKPLGIFFISFITVRCRLARLPEGISWRHIAGMGMMAGIGFTMSVFISTLAFGDKDSQMLAKLAVLLASLAAGLAGYFYLWLAGKTRISGVSS